MTGQIMSPEMAKLQRPQANVYNIGGLIVQTMSITARWKKSDVYNFNMAFPNGAIAVIVQGAHLDSSSGYNAPSSIQAQAISKTQYRVYMMSTVQDAPMTVQVIAIGY